MQVNIDGREYILATDAFRLTDAHFEEAAKRPNAFELIRWAWDNQSSVDEMLTWGRAIDLVVPLPAEKPAARKKPEPLVFGEKPKPKQVEATTPKLF